MIKTAEFIISNTKVAKCPKPDMPEYAFIGRSNVGKSSLINMLTNNKSLAKTSSKPGKTQLINHFLINQSWYLVDLPGYGYAKTSQTNREKWGEMITEYLLKRENLMTVFVLIDSRIDAQAIDLDFVYDAGLKQIPIVLLFTKTDKNTINQTNSKIAKYKKILQKDWEELPLIIPTSSVTKTGQDEILKYIEKTNLLFSNEQK